MKSVPLTAAPVTAIKAAIKAGRPLTLVLGGQPAARVQPIAEVTKRQAAEILREIAEAEEGDDWTDYASWK